MGVNNGLLDTANTVPATHGRELARVQEQERRAGGDERGRGSPGT